MADNRTMAQLLEAPTEGYEDAIVVPEITANNFEIKHGLLNLVQNKQFFGHDKEDPHAHIRYFNKITSTMKFPNVPSTSVKLMLFPFSLEGAARIWLEKEPPRSILTWDDLDRFNDLLRGCPHHGFSELHQLDTFYNALNSNDQDSLKMPRECLKIIESKSKVHQSRSKAIVSKAPAPAPVKAVKQSCVTCGGGHSYQNFPATDGNIYRDNIQEYMSQVAVVNYNQGNASYRPQMINQPPTFQAPPYQALVPPTPVVSKSDFDNYVKANDAVMQNMQNQMANITDLITKFMNSNTASTSGSGSLPSNTIANPKRANKEKLRENDYLLASKFYEIFLETPLRLSFADALLHMPKFAPMFRKLLNDKDKMIELTKTPMNECLALADLGASINLMPLSIWKELSLPALTKTRMILELADRTISTPTGIAEDVFVKVGTFFFPADFVVVDYVADPRVPLILGRPFLRMARALIDVHEYVQEVLEISESGNPTSTSDLMIDSRSPSFTPFGGSDFLMEEIDEFLEHDDSIPPVCEINVPEEIKSSCEDPPDLELKDLPSHLEYAFLEGNDKLPVIIAKNLKDEDKTALIKVLKSHKHAIAWKISDIKGIDPQFCTHKILMEENAKPVVQHQRRVNPKIHEVIKQEVIKLLDAGLIYPISDSPWMLTKIAPGGCAAPKEFDSVIRDKKVAENSHRRPTFYT
ncbi:reverse transcriptase domain-containing protein [Tanacetum coccineum]